MQRMPTSPGGRASRSSRVDERIRSTNDELAFAVAELGEGPTRDLREALDAVTHHLGEAFTLNQLNHDEIPDTAEELRTRNARIVQLCEWADDLLDDRTSTLAQDIERVRRAPEILAQVRVDAERLQGRLPHARSTLERLSLRYTEEALRQVSAGADEAEQLLTFAAHSADVSARRRDAGRAEEANLALETATEAVRRAEAILDGVEDFEIEALRAESTLADVDRRLPRRPRGRAPGPAGARSGGRRGRPRGRAEGPAGRGRQDRPVRRAVAAPRGEQRAGCRDRQGARPARPPDPLGAARASRAR